MASAARIQDVKYDVFVSHAGEQKREFVDLIYEGLSAIQRQAGSQFTVFMDDSSIRRGYHGWSQIETAARECSIAVCILTREFVRKQACIDEVRMFLDRVKPTRGANGGKDATPFKILPVFLGLSPSDCLLLRKAYADEPWVTTEDKPRDLATLDGWASTIAELCRLPTAQTEQEALVSRPIAAILDMVVEQLKAAGKLDPNFEHQSSFEGPFCLPPVRWLFGRDMEVEAVVGAVRDGRVVSVVGPPGEGKTWAAMHASYRLFREGAASGGVYRIDMAGGGSDEGAADWRQHIASMLHAEHVKCGSRATTSVVECMKQPSWTSLCSWLTSRKPGPVLLLLENCEAMLRPPAGAGGEEGVQGLHDQLKELLSEIQGTTMDGQRAAHVILTSRAPVFTSTPSENHLPHLSLSINALGEEPSKQLLKTRAGARVEWPGLTLPKLAIDTCRGNALALAIIGGFIQHGRCTPREAIDRYEQLAGGRLKDTVELTGLKRTDPATDLRAKKQYRVHTDWLQAYLSSQELLALAQLSVFRSAFSIGYAADVMHSLPMSDADKAMRQQGTVPETVKQFVELLVDISVVQPSWGVTGGDGFSMHLLLRELAGDMLQGRVALGGVTGDELQAARYHAVQSYGQTMLHILKVLHDRDPSKAGQALAADAVQMAQWVLAAELGNLLQLPWMLAQPEVQSNFECAGFVKMFYKIVHDLLSWGQFALAKRLAAALVARAVQVRGCMDPETILARLAVGYCHRTDSEVQQAEAVYRELIRDAEKHGNQYQVANAKYQLLYVLFLQGQRAWEEAVKVAHEAIETWERLGCLKQTTSVWSMLATVHRALGREADATAACAKAAAAGGDHPDDLLLQAQQLLTKGQWSEAEKLLVKAGGGTELYWKAYQPLAEYKMAQGKVEEAVELVEQGLAVVKGMFGERNIQYAKLLVVQAHVLVRGVGSSGACADAIISCGLAQNIYEQSSKENGFQIAFVYEAQGEALEKLGRWAEAAQAVRQAQAAFEVPAMKHPLMLKLARLLAKQRDRDGFAEAERVLDEVSSGLPQQPSDDRQGRCRLAVAFRELAVVVRSAGDSEGAERLFRKADALNISLPELFAHLMSAAPGVVSVGGVGSGPADLTAEGGSS